jgi:nucleoid DNA-binding protein
MNISKANIVKSITKKSKLSALEATDILESLLLLIKNKSKLRIVKLSSFGSFGFKKTPKRLGRNPKTKDSYIIPEINKLNFKPSNKIKEKIN